MLRIKNLFFSCLIIFSTCANAKVETTEEGVASYEDSVVVEINKKNYNFTSKEILSAIVKRMDQNFRADHTDFTFNLLDQFFRDTFEYADKFPGDLIVSTDPKNDYNALEVKIPYLNKKKNQLDSRNTNINLNLKRDVKAGYLEIHMKCDFGFFEKTYISLFMKKVLVPVSTSVYISPYGDNKIFVKVKVTGYHPVSVNEYKKFIDKNLDRMKQTFSTKIVPSYQRGEI